MKASLIGFFFVGLLLIRDIFSGFQRLCFSFIITFRILGRFMTFALELERQWKNCIFNSKDFFLKKNIVTNDVYKYRSDIFPKVL